ncbi:MAG: hypothetical protein JW842_00895 [Prolixibacteraceae bacterium]|nr:hypothetical protein [Prolixibacteraceae bacterium]
MDKVLSLSLGKKTLIWLAEINKYLIVNPPFDKIIELIYRGESKKSILEYCVVTLNLSIDEAKQTIQQVKNNLSKIEHQKDFSGNKIHSKLKNLTFDCKRFYQINGVVFSIEYEIPEIEYMIHPKFAHLEIKKTDEYQNHFQLFQIGNEIVLLVNGEKIGSWTKEMEHFMTGKVSMEILQKIHHNREKDWMAVFHAAGVSNGIESIMFLGDSGNGKSTLSAILLASGFEVLTDDFLPVESETSKLCSFPAAISIKKHAVDLLAPKFPELHNAHEYCYPLNKTVRYLSNPYATKGIPKKVPCKALVFVKYEVKSNLQFSTLSKDIAFQKLVPDSWLSPVEKNAKQFLNWFEKLPCYQLTYSNNEAMVEAVKNIFNDEL